MENIQFYSLKTHFHQSIHLDKNDNIFLKKDNTMKLMMQNA